MEIIKKIVEKVITTLPLFYTVKIIMQFVSPIVITVLPIFAIVLTISMAIVVIMVIAIKVKTNMIYNFSYHHYIIKY